MKMQIRKTKKDVIETELKIGDRIVLKVTRKTFMNEHDHHWIYTGVVKSYTKEREIVVLLVETTVDIFEVTFSPNEILIKRYRQFGLITEKYEVKMIDVDLKIGDKDAKFVPKNNYNAIVYERVLINRDWEDVKLDDLLTYIPEGKEYKISYISPKGSVYVVREDAERERLINKNDSQMCIQFGIRVV